MIDWNINLGNLLVLGTMVASILVFAYRVGGFSQNIQAMENDLKELRSVQQEMALLLTKVAVQQTRLDSHDKRMDTIVDQIEDIRHGRGFIDVSPPQRA